jgi:two-component system chemotaxis response regulator CheY
VDNAPDGNKALDSLRAKNYAVVISDWEMKPMSGPELVKAIRLLPDRASTRIILTTAYKFSADVTKLANADGCLMKPFTVAALRDKIEDVLSRPAAK